MDCEKCIFYIEEYPTEMEMFCIAKNKCIDYRQEKCNCYDDGESEVSE